MLIKSIQTYEELEEYFKSYTYVIINISAIWCKPCIALKPHIEKFLSVIDKKDYIYLKLDESDYNENPKFENLFHLKKIPYFSIIKNGNLENVFISGEFDFVSKKIYEYIKKNNLNIDFSKDEDF